VDAMTDIYQLGSFEYPKPTNIHIKGDIFNVIPLTPSSVIRFTKDNIQKLSTHEFTERYVFHEVVDSHEDLMAELFSSWSSLSFKDHEKHEKVGLYISNIKFPNACCVCNQPPTHPEFVELKESAFGYYTPNSIRRHPDLDEETNELLSDAKIYNRYWYAIPFCDEHSLEDKAIRFSENQIIGFTNREFATNFGKINSIEGHWLTSKRIAAKETRTCGCTILGLGPIILFFTWAVISNYWIDASYIDYIFLSTVGLSSIIGIALIIKGQRGLKQHQKISNGES
jgi:hypothetical protein